MSASLPSASRRILLLFVVSLVLIPAGCSDEDNSASCTGPDGQALSGRITGRAIGGSGPVSNATIEVTSLDASPEVRVTTYTDSTGTYDVAVRPGGYRAAVLVAHPGGMDSGPAILPLYYTPQGVVANRDSATAFTVACETQHIDLLFGTVQLRFSYPAELDDGWTSCELVPSVGSVPLEETPSDSAGMEVATFPILPPGVWRARLSNSRFSVWFNQGLSSSSADSFVIEPGALRTLETSFTAHRFSGTVTGSWQRLGTPYRPSVRLWDDAPHRSSPVSSVTADEAGNYSGVVLAPGHVRMQVVINEVENWAGGRSWDTAERFEIPETGDLRIPDYVEGGIHCRLVGLRDDWAEMTLEAAAGDWHDWSLPDSVCSLPNLAPGTYYLSVVGDLGATFRPQYYDRADSRETATPIVISGDGSVVPITITIERGATLSGRVLRWDGTARGICTQLRIWTEHFGYRNDYWASRDGSFRVEGLPPGKVKLGAWHGTPSFLTWYDGTLDEDQAHVFEIQGDEEISGIEFRFLPVKLRWREAAGAHEATRARRRRGRSRA
jgi:hypothetical protein